MVFITLCKSSDKLMVSFQYHEKLVNEKILGFLIEQLNKFITIPCLIKSFSSYTKSDFCENSEIARITSFGRMIVITLWERDQQTLDGTGRT